MTKTPPKVIHSEEENEYYIGVLEEMERRGHLDEDEKAIAELLTVLIEKFEDAHYQLRPSTPLEVIAELMDANNLRQKDLVDVFGTESVVSEVLNGKRELNKDHIKRLIARFNVSPELFF
ncbi:MAG TPA: helix-turn-helix domain-containing protein [Terriglobales bacterium]|nr:helix-turn-helix domain-containing protein [Terriglobales bacterium]